MKCTRCEYPLWNLKDRRCPECGQDFAPSQFKFVPRAVRFCCPHCEQHYFGTGVEGHLVPRVFDCVTCGAHIHMDEMVLSPVGGEEAQATVDVAPWLRKDHRFLSRWFRTLGGGLGAPKKHIKAVPIESSVGAAIGFAAFTATVATGIGIAGLFAFMVIGTLFTAGRGSPVAIMGVLAIAYALALGALAVWLAVWILVTHFILAITGATAGGLRRTTQCLSYASAPNILYAVPCLNFYLWPVTTIWSVITGTIMLIHGQKVSRLRAIVAAATPPLILGTGIAAFTIAVIVPAIRSAMVLARTAATQAGATMHSIRVQSLSSSLNAQALSDGAYPVHAAQLLDSGVVSSTEFSLSTSPMAGASAVVGKTTLGEIETLPPPRRTAAIKAIADAQPADVVAHRVGDYVFTYHGLSPGTADIGLWVLIAEVGPVPVPNVPPQGAPPGFIACTAGGQTIPISRLGLARALAEQNDLRATYTLPPLPDPTTVLPASPATAPPTAPATSPK